MSACADDREAISQHGSTFPGLAMSSIRTTSLLDAQDEELLHLFDAFRRFPISPAMWRVHPSSPIQEDEIIEDVEGEDVEMVDDQDDDIIEDLEGEDVEMVDD
ncbi:hypothetical protein OC834_007510, partial [Tilletia horrida]